MSKYTPGSWYADELGPYRLVYVQRGNVGGFRVEGGSVDENMADAMLIAAAPELAEAVKFMLSAINNPNPDAADHVAAAEEKARAALRKAGLLEGGE